MDDIDRGDDDIETPGKYKENVPRAGPIAEMAEILMHSDSLFVKVVDYYIYVRTLLVHRNAEPWKRQRHMSFCRSVDLSI